MHFVQLSVFLDFNVQSDLKSDAKHLDKISSSILVVRKFLHKAKNGKYLCLSTLVYYCSKIV